MSNGKNNPVLSCGSMAFVSGIKQTNTGYISNTTGSWLWKDTHFVSTTCFTHMYNCLK